MRTLLIVGLAAGLLASLSIEANVNPASHVLVKREAPERIAFPKDGKNKDAITRSEKTILDATGLKEVYGFTTSDDDEFLHWVFKAEGRPCHTYTTSLHPALYSFPRIGFLIYSMRSIYNEHSSQNFRANNCLTNSYH